MTKQFYLLTSIPTTEKLIKNICLGPERGEGTCLYVTHILYLVLTLVLCPHMIQDIS